MNKFIVEFLVSVHMLKPLKMTAGARVMGRMYFVVYIVLAWAVYIGIVDLRKRRRHMQAAAETDRTQLGRQLFPSQAFVIALDKGRGDELIKRINETLGVKATFIEADRGGNHSGDLHIFTRYMMDTGRVDHKLIGNRAMVGCLMSHVRVWRALIERGEPAFVFEEDAVFDDDSGAMVANQLHEASAHDWSALMLTERVDGRLQGEIRFISQLLATCDACDWYGTRAYIITPEGASVLLEYYLPFLVQVDGLMGLVNAYDDRFRMIWVRDTSVGQVKGRVSTVQDSDCPKCYHLRDYMPFGF
jgi:GR25 family glycosyltransferase involved in LPS biosynthesis